MSATLRALHADDIPFIARIEREASANPWSENQLRAELSKPESRAWVALDGSAPAGFIVVWHVADEVQLAEFAVDPARRRRGMGRALLRKVCEDAAAEGLKRVTLEVREGNMAARALYISEGFVLTFRRPRFYDQKEAALLMEKKLSASDGKGS